MIVADNDETRAVITDIACRLAVALLLTLAMALGLGTGKAHGDDTTVVGPSVVCQQLALGQTPGEIADELHRGNPTLPCPYTTVWDAMPNCP
jgi:hypothetical protein